MSSQLKTLPVVEFAMIVGFRQPHRETEWSYRLALATHLLSDHPILMHAKEIGSIKKYLGIDIDDMEALAIQIMDESILTVTDFDIDSYQDVFVKETATEALLKDGKNAGRCQVVLSFDRGILASEARKALRAEIRNLARGEVDGMIRDEVIEALRNRYTKDHIAAVAKDCVEKYANSYWFRSELKEEAVKQVGTIVESERNAIRAVINENKQIAFEEANIEKIVRRVLKNKFS